MTEKITRAQAEAAVTHLADVARDGTGWYDCCEKYAVALRAYLAQPEGGDVEEALEAVAALDDIVVEAIYDLVDDGRSGKGPQDYLRDWATIRSYLSHSDGWVCAINSYDDALKALERARTAVGEYLGGGDEWSDMDLAVSALRSAKEREAAAVKRTVEKAKEAVLSAIEGCHGETAPACCDRCAYLWTKACEDRDSALAALDSLRDGKEWGMAEMSKEHPDDWRPAEDVVRKAHEIIATLRRTLCDENAGDPGCPCLDCQDFDVVASALPPLPEEK